MEVTVGEKTYVAGPKDTVLITRNVMHHHRNLGDTSLKFLFISAMLDE